jgi:N4-(beta-N-acetylglucosaminyl)-L-asparaginase
MSRFNRRTLLSAIPGAAALACSASPSRAEALAPRGRRASADKPVLVGSANALRGMKEHYARLVDGAEPLDIAIDVVKVVEADPNDHSVGLGGVPNEDGVVQLDAAVMHGPTHNAGSVAAIENILHPCEVARLVMERTDHCMLVGRGAYEFARQHGHPRVELLTEEARQIWMRWKESMSDRDDRLAPREKDERQGGLAPMGTAGTTEQTASAQQLFDERTTGTIHCSALSVTGEIACTTTTSGLAYKIPGRIGDSPIIGAGLYCDQEAGSAGATGRGEAAILSTGSTMIVELMRQGAAPVDAGLEVLRRVTRQAQRASSWQPGLVDEQGLPSFGLHLYILGLDGSWAGVTLKGGGKFAVADAEGGPRHEQLVPLHG